MYQLACRRVFTLQKSALKDGLMTSRAEQLEDMGGECRALANAATHAEVREQLLEVAEQFERLARHCRLYEIVQSRGD
jgi:hypothetical protein